MTSTPIIANYVKIQPKVTLPVNKAAPISNITTLVPFLVNTVPPIISPVITTPVSSCANNSTTEVNSNPTQPLTTVPPSVPVENIQVDHLQQLSTNALPSYFPNSPPDFIKSGVSSFEFHCCSDCGDTFALKSSLTFHLERRSVLIKFPCDTCKTVCVFTNRCSLLSHIRNHKDKNEASNINKAVVIPLPKNLSDGLRNDMAKSVEDKNKSTENISVNDLLETSFDEPEESIQSSTLSTTNNAQFRCWDCNEMFHTESAREKHLTNEDRVPSILHQCNKCTMICPSKCAFKAHQRIHLQVSPYVCPECGGSPDFFWVNFQNHVTYKCFHYARSIGYRCHVCLTIHDSHELLLKHMEIHTEKYLKCDTCPRAYLSRATFEAHINANHKKEEKVSYNVIYKCSLCEVVFLDVQQMRNHRSTHIKKETAEYNFTCSECPRKLDTKMKLLEHIKTAHPKSYKLICEIYKNSPTNLSAKLSIQCLLCSKIFSCTGKSNNENLLSNLYKNHMKSFHSQTNRSCKYCYTIFPNHTEMIQHGKKHLSMQSIVCLLCENKFLNDTDNLEKHLKGHVSSLGRNMTCCPLCNNLPLHSSQEALLHLKAEHLFSSLPSKENPFVCLYCKKPFDDKDDLSNHIITIHKKESENKTKEPPFKKAHNDYSFNCYKCSFASEDKPKFKEHIVTHKLSRNTFQCQECGICFIVLPALEKHLRITHKIANVEQYIEKEGTNFTPEADNKKNESSTCDALICDVCFTTFPTENALNTHMRIHGLAFLQANKSDSKS